MQCMGVLMAVGIEESRICMMLNNILNRYINKYNERREEEKKVLKSNVESCLVELLDVNCFVLSVVFKSEDEEDVENCGEMFEDAVDEINKLTKSVGDNYYYINILEDVLDKKEDVYDKIKKKVVEKLKDENVYLNNKIGGFFNYALLIKINRSIKNENYLDKYLIKRCKCKDLNYEVKKIYNLPHNEYIYICCFNIVYNIKMKEEEIIYLIDEINKIFSKNAKMCEFFSFYEERMKIALLRRFMLNLME